MTWLRKCDLSEGTWTQWLSHPSPHETREHKGQPWWLNPLCITSHPISFHSTNLHCSVAVSCSLLTQKPQVNVNKSSPFSSSKNATQYWTQSHDKDGSFWLTPRHENLLLQLTLFLYVIAQILLEIQQVLPTMTFPYTWLSRLKKQLVYLTY